MKKIRESNIELLRIIAMLLVLVVHSDFLAIGNPNIDELTMMPYQTITRFFCESIAICCVNVFVLISGWFGIRSKVKGALNLLFQCLFFALVLIVLNLITGFGDSVKPVAFKLLLMFNWFVVSYFGLFFLSPILNAFIENSSKKVCLTIIIILLLFEFVFGFATQMAPDFNMGYSILSFVILYLLARYCNVYKPIITTYSAISYILVFGICVIIHTLVGLAIVKSYIPLTIQNYYNYYNPIVVIQSLSLLLLFSKLDIQSIAINWVAKSCFAVFLLHTHPYVSSAYLYPFIKNAYFADRGQAIFMVLIFVFIVAIILDKIRLQAWNIVLYIIDRFYGRKQYN